MKVRFTYFKASGKYYASGEAEYPEEPFWDFITRMRDKVRAGEAFPGMGSWHDPILIQIQDQPPQLINVGRYS